MTAQPIHLEYGRWYKAKDGTMYQCRGEGYAGNTYLLRHKSGMAFTASGVHLRKDGTIHWEQAYGRRYMKY